MKLQIGLLNNMENNNLLEILKSAGLNVAANEENVGTLYESRPHYKGNFGFHHVGAKNFQAILVKGVYKDFLRIVEGKTIITESGWNEVAKALNISETSAKSPVKLTFFIRDGLCFVTNAVAAENNDRFAISKDMRDYTIPRPLTDVEYMLPSSKLYDEEVMVSAGFFADNFPRVMSYFTESVFVKIPDILNPIFVSCNLKTTSPSTIPVYNRLYINMTAYEKMLKAIGIGIHPFRMSFAPHLYIKQMDTHKIKGVNKSYFPVETKEITDLLAEIERTTPHINAQSVTEDKFFDFPVQITIAYEYISIMLEDCLASLLKIFPNLTDVLHAVFKTRNNSIFNMGKLNLPTCLDFASAPVETTFVVEKKVEPIDQFIKALPFFKRLRKGSKAKKLLKNVHELLNLRDRTYLAYANFILKSREALLEIGNIAVKKDKAASPEDIFYFEHDEVKRIYSDSFFGDADQTINFRKWQIKRYAAQTVPPEIFGTDLEKCPQISEQMVSKFLELAEHKTLPLNDKEVSGIVTNDLNKTDFSGYILAAASLYLPDMPKFKSAAGFILENASPFAFAAEYAIINDIPLYVGVRFAPLILNGSKVKAAGNKISKI